MKNSDRRSFLQWYQENKRPLPWRAYRDPYPIWISETMLQQTTSTAVIPFFERFLQAFPTLESLAKASIEQVYELWAGLGYYSRARNLHKAAQLLVKNGGFPKTYPELIEYPGFGPYTSRAVSSLAFGEHCGVLDGNVIRFLSRFYGLSVEWWKPKARAELQALSDAIVQHGPPQDLNQALMEIGATICTPKSPSCFLCPVSKNCVALSEGIVEQLPLKKPRKESEIWLWEADVIERKGKIGFVKNTYAPFLRGQWLLPGRVSKTKVKPKKYDFEHSITHHQIFVSVRKNGSHAKDLHWISIDDVSKHVPVSLVKKVLLTIRPRSSTIKK